MTPPPQAAGIAAAVALAVALLAAPAPAQAPTYHLIRRVALPGAVRWDYLTIDPVRRRLFVAHDAEVLVLDLDSATVIGRIEPTAGVHGVALAPDLGRGFASDGRDATVTEFDLATLRVLDRRAVTGRQPDAILYDSVARRVFTFNGGSADATVLDAAADTVVGTIALGGTPEFAVPDGRGRLFVNLEDRDSVVAIDTRTLEPVARWALAPCGAPTAMAMDRKRRQLFIGCRNRLLAIVDADRGTVEATLPIGAGVDAVVFDPATHEVLSANGDGTLTVIGRDAHGRYHVVDTVATARGARTLAFDAATRRVFLVTAEFGPTPAPTEANPHPRPVAVPGTFGLLILGP